MDRLVKRKLELEGYYMKKCILGRLILLFMVLIFYGTLSFAQEGGDLIWKTSVGWHVHSVSSAGDVNNDGYSDLFIGSGNNLTYCLSGGGLNKGTIIWSWNVTMDVWSVTSLSDINGDGVNDCLAGTGNDTLYCFSGKPTSGMTEILWSYPTNGDIWSVAPIGDLNGDGINDCLAGSADDKVYCYSGSNGRRLWSYRDVADILAVRSIPDVDGDGKEDCLAGGHGNRVLCISGGSSGTGKLLWYYKIYAPVGSSVLSVASIEDVDGDGIADCLASGLHEKIYCISGASRGKADLIWGYPTGAKVLSVESISDVNGDGIADCLAGGLDDKVFCISGGTGKLIWSYSTVHTVFDVDRISDVNGDGIEDCIAGEGDNKVHCIDGKFGTKLWSSSTFGSVVCVTSISDISGNGVQEVIGGSDDSYVYVYEGGEGIEEVLSTPDIPTGPSEVMVGTAVEFSTGGSESNLGHSVEYRFDWGDGNFSGWDDQTQQYSWQSEGYYLVKAQARCALHPDIKSDWSEGLSVHISSTEVEQIETSEIPTKFYLYQNYPNPFNNKTCITFQLQQFCSVQLEIFNMSGDIVKKFPRSNYTAGKYRIYWNSKNDSKQPLPSGLYFYRLQAGSYHSVRTMLYVK